MYDCCFSEYIPGTLQIPSVTQVALANNPLGQDAVGQILSDFVEIANLPECALKSIDLGNCCSPGERELTLADTLREIGWTVFL